MIPQSKKATSQIPTYIFVVSYPFVKGEPPKFTE